MDDKKKRRRRGLFAGLGAGAGVIGALLTLGLIGLSGMGEDHARPAWLKSVITDLKGRAYEWIDVELADKVATVSGEAPDVDSQRFGFEAAAEAIKATPEGGDLLVIDNVSLKGGGAGLGAALKALGLSPEAGACQNAFKSTLAGRTINFEVGSANINADSARLLDALTGVAIRCKAYKVEIAGHTDLSGSPRRNLALSEARANAVRDYLLAKGVDETQLEAVGYGQTRPLISARGPDADAQNRRIEFTVAMP